MKNRFNFWSAIAAEQEKTSMWRDLEKTKKPKLFGEVLVSGQKMFFFWFSLSIFVFFWFRFLKTKKNLGVFGFSKEVFVEERQKTKKLVFFMDCSYMYSKHLTKN